MHILLTDILSCPRCGPEFGLILLADRIEARRVLAGTLGCANCRSKYPIRDGAADLRAAGAAEPGREAPATATESSSEAALRWAALLGVTEGPGYLLVIGPAAALAAEIASLIEHIEVIAATDGSAPLAGPPAAGVSRIAVAGRLPFYSGHVHGVALSGDSADALLEEGARVLRPLGRLVIEPAPADAEERIRRAGLSVLAHQDRTLVAARVA